MQTGNRLDKILVSVLSIDGGGVRGLIPATVIGFLESELQKIDGADARIAHYFDVVGGTSTGGIITSMLTTPNENGRSLFSAREVKNFYLEHSSNIFPCDSLGAMGGVRRLVNSLKGPKYDGNYLRKVIRERLGSLRLHNTLTNIVVPAFDVMTRKPVIFSSYNVKKDPSIDVLLSDICIGTSAAPTYLPAHYFENKTPWGQVRQFNLIDGGIFANNPASLALRELVGDVIQVNRQEEVELLVVSLGTGSDEGLIKYSAQCVSQWGSIGWFYNWKLRSSPLVEFFNDALKGWNDQYISDICRLYRCNFFRVQDDGLKWPVSSTDISTKENLNNLVVVGERLLEAPVRTFNFEDSHKSIEVTGQRTNKEELIRLAHILSDARKRRILAGSLLAEN